MRTRLEGGLSESPLRLCRRWFRGRRRFRGHRLWRHVLGLRGRAVSERISGLVRHHTDDRDDNDNARNPHRSFVLNLAWIAAHWPHLVAEVVFVEISHGDGSFLWVPPGRFKRLLPRSGSNTGYLGPLRHRLRRRTEQPPSATVQGACLEGGLSGNLLRLHRRRLRGWNHCRYRRWRHVMGIDGSVVIARIVGLVREHAYYDSSDNSDSANPYRTVALKEARI